jgi:hypothetical protein
MPPRKKIQPAPVAPVAPVAAEQVAPAAEPPIVLDITFNLDHMSVADLPLVHKMRRGQALDVEIVELFDRVVVGGSKAIPFPALGQACKQFYGAIFGASDPETDAGN